MYSFSIVFILKIPKLKVNRFLNTTLCKRALPSPDNVLQIDGFKSRLPPGTCCPCRSKDSEDSLATVRGNSNAGTWPRPAWIFLPSSLPTCPESNTDGPTDVSPQGLPQSHLPPFSLTKRSRRSWTAARRGGIWQCAQKHWWLADSSSVRGKAELTEYEWEPEYITVKVRHPPPLSSFAASQHAPSVSSQLTPFQAPRSQPIPGPQSRWGWLCRSLIISSWPSSPLTPTLSPPQIFFFFFFFSLKCSNHCFSNHHCSNHWDFLF